MTPPHEVAGLAAGSWQHTTLAFHRSTRAAPGATGAAAEAPAVAPPRSDEVVELPRSAARPREFAEVLAARASRRTWSPLTAGLLGEFLRLSAGNRAAGPQVRRPYPSGGARYSLELYPVLGPGSVDGVPAGVYRLRPETCALERLSSDPDRSRLILAAAAAASGVREPAPVAVVVTSRFERVSSGYGPLAYSLVLKEVGGLFQTMYLVGEYLGLSVCALGGGTPDRLIGELVGPDEPVVGELVVGGR